MPPLVVIVDWSTAPQGDPESTLEREVLGGAARVIRCLCETDADFPPEIEEAAAVILWHNLRLTERGIARLRNCRAVIRNGAGYDSVDLEAAGRAGIAVCNVPDYGTEEVADHALALALALCRQLFPLHAEAMSLGWNIPTPGKMRRLRHLTFGVAGLGRIGTAAALRARAFGFRVLFFDPYLPSGADKALGIDRALTLDELLGSADVLSLHCPLTAETRHMIGAEQIARMRDGAFLVNTARGEIVEKTALLAALRSGKLGGAGLDVIEDEPLSTAEEAAAPNLIATCHAAFCSVESKQEMRVKSAGIALAAVTGATLVNVVN
jgi:phosphoglycerate dehydrogenase-like enzyme